MLVILVDGVVNICVDCLAILDMPEIAQAAAHLVDAHSITDIHEGIQKLIADASYREQLIQNGFQNAARFSAASLAQQYAAIYRLIVNL